MMKKAFTMVELLVVLAIIAFLTAAALYGLNKAQAVGRDTSRQQIMTAVQSALERYYADNQVYPNVASVPTATDFCTMMMGVLATYVTMPKDPGASKPLLCTASGDGNPTRNSATYSYTGTTSTYQLTLTRESGGSGVVFNNPN